MNGSTEIYNAILAMEKEFMATFSQGDSAGISAFYTENAQLMAPHNDFLTGRQAIQAAFQSFMDMGIIAMNLDTLEVEGSGDLAYEVGKYSLEIEGGQVVDEGKYIVVWKQVAGQWKLHRDIFNTNLPAPE
ncbi:DUF4440 domain-containing protein [Hahella sp. CCB-MM4]|uniref:YybH family protein n=1 Tax=Hahella sp. (strain CCB-MM4) TaxID=1926491 RepID=UPI000B9B42CA|nr:DUF4440 domain-containing protein [Hahella sp. CCB-MM4]OZG74335.1 DUF4440 domain-containing protein [Hahella sp. CCB-MM4]